MSIAYKNNRALKRVLQNSIRGAAQTNGLVKQANGSEKNGPAYSLCADIPESYNDAYVRAIPKDPQNSFVYWEMPKEEQANGRALGGKGAAHVGNGDAHRIREELERQGANGGGNGGDGSKVNSGDNGDNGNSPHYKWMEREQTRLYLPDDNHHDNWQDGDNQQYHGQDVDNQQHQGHDGDNQHHLHGCHHHHIQWDDNHYHEHCQGDGHDWHGCNEHQHNCHNDNCNGHDTHHHIRWDGNSYHKHCHKHNADYWCGFHNPSHDDNSHPYNHTANGTSSAFYAMIEKLIAQCSRYLLECRQGASGLCLPIPSSGEFYSGANNNVSPYSAPPLSSSVFYSSGIFYNAGAKKAAFGELHP